MKTLNRLLAEAREIEPNGIKNRFASVKRSDKVLGTLSKEGQQLFCVMQAYAVSLGEFHEAAKGIVGECGGKTVRDISDDRLDELNAKHRYLHNHCDLATALFVAIIRDEFPAANEDDLVIRTGWKVAVSDQLEEVCDLVSAIARRIASQK
ncbi:MAG TPA: hypothetical protein VI937_02360 [Negativicutes bacterium]|nr:hypothetical protein [Negativicutes bacterium]